MTNLLPAIVLVLFGAAASHEQTPVATVDGLTIPRPLFDMYVRNHVAEVGLHRQQPGAGVELAHIEKAVLAELIDRTLVESEALRRGLATDQSALADARRSWIGRLGGEGAYRAYLAEHALSEDDFLRVVRQEHAARALRESLLAELLIASDDIADVFHREHGNPKFNEIFIEPETAEAMHILIAARPSAVERQLRENRQLSGTALAKALRDEMDKRRARAEAIRQKVSDGADFATLAREQSDDAGTRSRGGDLGRFTRGTHTAAFDDVVFAQPPGSLSEVIQTEYGFHVIKVTARLPRRRRSLDEAGPGIEQHLRSTRGAERLRRWLEQRRRDAVIQIHPTGNERDRALARPIRP